MVQTALFTEKKAAITPAAIYIMIWANGGNNPPEIIFHSDPGHGWLQIPLSLMKKLKIQPSRYSYKDSRYAYLEEDCDLSLFIIAAGIEDAIADFWKLVPQEETDNDSKIRRKNHF